jgi:hypothetical protein
MTKLHNKPFQPEAVELVADRRHDMTKIMVAGGYNLSDHCLETKKQETKTRTT